MKKARLAVETLESRELLAVAAGALFDAPPLSASSALPAALPLATSAEGIVSLSGEGIAPVSGAEYADVTVHLSTTRAAAADFASLTLFVGIQEAGLATVSVSQFDPAAAGFQIADKSIPAVPEIKLTPLFTTNLISNGSWAFYLYPGGENAPVDGAWYIKATWFNPFSGDWTGGADTVGAGIDLVSLRLNLNPELIRPTTVEVNFDAQCGEGWTVDADSYTFTAEPKATSNLVACPDPSAVTVQTGCNFFVSGAGSYAVGARPIASWRWGYTSAGSADAEGEEVWLSANKLKYTQNSASVSLVVGDAVGNLSLPAEVRVTRVPVAPSVTGKLSSFVGGRVVVADLCYSDAAGEVGTFWEIDWGDGTVEEFTFLSNTLSASHVYQSGVAAAPAVRVTNSAGEVSAFSRIG